ncbi:hypothetical protein TNCV_1192951 [Trichonephila clavipes]|nr:hypothetical protein TNCV_1192951 [Trichonephila clavipes]
MSHHSATRGLFGDETRNFEPWSSDVDDTRSSTQSPDYHTIYVPRKSGAVVAVWSRYRIVAGLVRSSSPVPLKTRRYYLTMLNLTQWTHDEGQGLLRPTQYTRPWALRCMSRCSGQVVCLTRNPQY